MFRFVKQSKPLVLIQYQPWFQLVDRFTEHRCLVCFEKLGPLGGFPCPECKVKIHGDCRGKYRTSPHSLRVHMVCRSCGETD